MASFRPQRVPPASIRLWLRESFALCRRQPLWFLGVAVAWTGVGLLPLPLGFLMLLGLALPLAAGCLVAHAADTSRSPIDVLAAITSRAWLDLLLAGALPWLAVGAAILAIASLAQPVLPQAEPLLTVPQFARAEWQPFRDLLAAIFLWLATVGVAGWFVVPLMALAGLPLLQAFSQAVQAISLNGFVIALVYGIAAVGVPLAALLSPLLAAPLLAMLSSLMYVSFRHVWLGQGSNMPEVTRVTLRDLQPIPVAGQQRRHLDGQVATISGMDSARRQVAGGVALRRAATIIATAALQGR